MEHPDAPMKARVVCLSVMSILYNACMYVCICMRVYLRDRQRKREIIIQTFSI